MPPEKPLPVIMGNQWTDAQARIALAEVQGYLDGQNDVFGKTQAELAAIQARTDLTDKEKRLLIHKYRTALHKQKRTLQDNIGRDHRKRAELRSLHDALSEIIEWAEAGVTLQPGAGNPVPEIAAALESGDLLMGNGDRPAAAWFSDALEGIQTFAIEHDWAAAFAGATDFHDGEVVMPAASTAFAFRLSGKRVLAVFAGEPMHYAVIHETKQGWILSIFEPANLAAPATETEQPTAIAWQQIRAACIMLDAEIAERSPQRAPFFPEASPLPRVPLPLFDYHVLSLRRRGRTVQTDGEPTGNKRRLHFRRGHWRHYATFKTWVRWTLVGNPDLGFVDKEYRL